MLAILFLSMDLFATHRLHYFFPWFCLISLKLHFTFDSFNLLFSLASWLLGFEFSIQTRVCFHVLIIWTFFISLKDYYFCELVVMDDITSYVCGPSLRIYNLGLSCFPVCFFLSFFAVNCYLQHNDECGTPTTKVRV